MERVAGRLKAFTEEEALTIGAARRKLPGRDRQLIDAAVDIAVSRGWIGLDGNVLSKLGGAS